MPNQSQINSRDQAIWKRERRCLYHRIRHIAKITNSHFESWHGTQGWTELITKSRNPRMLSALLFDQIPEHGFWREIDKLCQQHGKNFWFVTDNILDAFMWQFDHVHVVSLPKLLGMVADHTRQICLRPPSRLYNCFMQRCEYSRQRWFYQLWCKGLLPHGYVSYLLYQLDDYSLLTGIDLFQHIHYNSDLHQQPELHRAYMALRDHIPFKNFDENNDLIPLTDDSKYSVILETYAMDDDRGSWCMTEKVLRALQSPAIDLIWAQRHTAAKLCELGLEVSSSNHHWDTLDWRSRQDLILDTVLHDTVPLDLVHQQAKAQHNLAVLCSWKKLYQHQDFFDQLSEDIMTS